MNAQKNQQSAHRQTAGRPTRTLTLVWGRESGNAVRAHWLDGQHTSEEESRR